MKLKTWEVTSARQYISVTECHHYGWVRSAITTVEYGVPSLRLSTECHHYGWVWSVITTVEYGVPSLRLSTECHHYGWVRSVITTVEYGVASPRLSTECHHYGWVSALTAIPTSLVLQCRGQGAGLVLHRPGFEAGWGDFSFPLLQLPTDLSKQYHCWGEVKGEE